MPFTIGNVTLECLPGGGEDDRRRLVVLHAAECRQCKGWVFPPSEDDTDLYPQQHSHFKQTGHRNYYHYRIQRGRSEVMTPLTAS